MKLLDKILHHSVRELTRAAAVIALVGLAIMSISVVVPRPLPVILAMSVGHVIGAAALACYLLAVILHVSRRPRSLESLPPPVSAAPRDDQPAA
jgi:hypothetical protein